MSFNKVNVQFFKTTLTDSVNNITEGGCTLPPKNGFPTPKFPFEPPIFGQPPTERIPPGEIGPPICIKPPFDRLPPEIKPPFIGINPPLPQGKEADVYRNGDGKIVLDAGDGNDNINVTQNPFGGVCVEVNGEKYHFTAAQARNLEIRGGSGNDNISVSDNVTKNLTLKGGSGDDRIKGGSGNDLIDGGSGDDQIYGGCGNDSIRGGSGDDELHGNCGNDVLIGGNGDDNLNGGCGSDWEIQSDFRFLRSYNNMFRV